MSDDIVTRLRDYLAIVDHAFVWNELSEAADEIERLQAERDRWRKIADRLVSGAERQIDEWRPEGKNNTNDAWLSAWHEYDQAVRGE